MGILKWSKFNEDANPAMKYYQNISYLEYSNFLKDSNIVQFNSNEYSILSNVHEYEFSQGDDIFITFRSRFIYGHKANKGRIYKVEDEWYLVELDRNPGRVDDPIFKCDQIDGLVRLLRKIWGNPSFEVNESTDFYSSTWDKVDKAGPRLNFSPGEKKKLIVDIENIFNMYMESLYVSAYSILIQLKKNYFQGLKISISKHEDEWYILHIDNYNTFSCDQYDGLLQCLRDIRDDFDNIIKIHNNI